MTTILAADIGGTNSRFGHFETRADGTLHLVRQCSIPSQTVRSFPELLGQLVETDFPRPREAEAIVLAVAGVVQDGIRCQLTNAPWNIDLSSSGLPVERTSLINDFVAQAYGCLVRDVAASMISVQAGAHQGGVQAVVGAGTGLGHCALVPLPNGEVMALPSEGGHAPLACLTEHEYAFQRFLCAQSGHSHLFGDMVVSGRGLSSVHEFLTGKRLSPAEVAAEINPQSETAIWFSRFYGRACRSYVLQVLAKGGLFLCGGLAAKNPWLVTNAAFTREFADSPTYGQLLSAVPIALVTSKDAGLLGAARYGQKNVGQ